MNTRTRQSTTRFLTAATITALAGLSSSATIVGASGAITVLPAPPDALPGGALESNFHIFAFDEKQGPPIMGVTPVNMIGKPQTVWFDPGIQGFLLPGIDVDSHLLELDPRVGSAHLSGIVRFDKPIVGVQILTKQLDATDYLGAPGTVYPAPPIPGSVPDRGLDWYPGATEVVRILPSLHELAVDLWASNSIDHIRVLTSNQRPEYDLAAPLPLPGDTDGDGDIDDSDLANAFSNYTGPMVPGAGGKGPWDGDADGDGDVDDGDLALLFSGYTGPLSPTVVPEPGAIALLGLGGAMIFRRRRD